MRSGRSIKRGAVPIRAVATHTCHHAVMSLLIPNRLAESARRSPEGKAWLDRLPATLQAVRRRWSLTVKQPFDGNEVSAAWVAPVRLRDGSPAVLKLGLPHPEAEQEIDGLRFWNGDPTVQLLDADEELNAMLLERCTPGTWLRLLPEKEQDVIIGGLLRRLWRTPAARHPFRPLSAMISLWIEQTMRNQDRWPDAGLVREGIRLFEELGRSADGAHDVLLGTDVHAGNVLRAQRQPWLVIDPKPFVGDRAYDATQHLLNCERRMRDDPIGTISRFADLLELEGARVRLWVFARTAAEPGDYWEENRAALTRSLVP